MPVSTDELLLDRQPLVSCLSRLEGLLLLPWTHAVITCLNSLRTLDREGMPVSNMACQLRF